MQKINIPLLGLTSNSEARGAKDGECIVMHNLTADGGGTKVIAPPTRETLAQRSVEYFHEKPERWLYIKSGCVYDEHDKLVNTLDGGTADGSVNSLSFMGNIVVMYCADGVRYAIFDGGYRYLGRLPKMPELKIDIKPIHVTTLTDDKYYSDTADISASDEGLRWKNVSKGFFDECLSALYTQGAFVDRTLLRWAARLFDGSYVCYSPIYYVEDSDALIQNIGYYLLGKSHDIGRDNMNFFSSPLSLSSTDRSKYFTSVRGFIPYFHLEPYDLSRWKDIIVSIDFFATPSIMGHESRNDSISVESTNLDTDVVQGGATVQLTTVDGYDRYEWKGAKKIRKEVAAASLFYKIAEFDLRGKELWSIENTSPTQLAVQSRLPVNEQPHELNSATFKYIYNGKMHLGGVSELFADAYDSYLFSARSSEKVIQITSVVTLATEQGERRVVTTTTQPSLSKDADGLYMLSPLLHYADTRATNLRICVACERSLLPTVIYRDFPLTPHKNLNLAIFLNNANMGSDSHLEITNTFDSLFVEVGELNKENLFVKAVKDAISGRVDYSGTYVFTYMGEFKWNLKVTFTDSSVVEIKDTSPYLYGLNLEKEGGILDLEKDGTITVNLEYGTGMLAGLNPIKVGGAEWSTITADDADFSFDANNKLTGFTLKNIEENRSYTRKHVMRVSHVDNPLFFPAKSTYSFDADIVALCSNTVAVSQGQFGQHPLYVFTDEGVWLMSVDASGAGSYLAQVPCSREICNNASGVSVTTRGVVFPTTKGLMLINGGETVNISEALAGLAIPELVPSTDGLGRICSVVGREKLCHCSAFLDYLVGAFTAFDYNGDLLYVCNPDYDYVYVYNNASGVWSTADGRYSAKVDYSDKLILGSVAETEYVRYTFNRHHERVSTVPVLLVTRACSFSSLDYKRISESALRGTFHAAKFGFYALGSLDGVKWELVGGRDLSKESPSLCRDVFASFVRSRAYRYFAFAFVGEVRSDARLAIIEVAAQSDFYHKIR